MSGLDRCEYCVKRGIKLLRCLSKVRQTVYIEGETLRFCPTHAALVMRLLAQKEKLERYYTEKSRQIKVEEQKIIEAWRELQQGEQGG